MSKTQIKIIAIVILVIVVILGIGTGLLAYYSNGFQNWDKFKPSLEAPVEPDKPNEVPTDPAKPNYVVVNKELVSTTYVTEKYGTFEVPVNHIIKNTNDFGEYTYLYFPNGTNLVPLFEGTVAYSKEYPNLLRPIDIDINDVRFFISPYGSIEDMLLNKIELTYDTSSRMYYFVDNKVTYKNCDGYDVFLYMFNIKFCENNSSQGHTFNANVFVTSEKEIIDMSDNLDGSALVEIPVVKLIVSDNGTPLTEVIYKEMLQDSTTQIIKNYKE